VTTSVCIAHGGDLSEPSGGTARIGAFAAELAERGADVSVVAPRPDDDLGERFDAVAFHPVSVGTRGVVDQPVRAYRVVQRARAVADERDARLQVEHSTLAGGAALLGADGFVLDMHDFAHRSPLYGDLPLGSAVQSVLGRIEGRGLRAASEVVVVSERMADLAAESWNLPTSRFTVVPNGYDPDVVAPYRETETVPGRVTFLGTLHRKVDADALVAVADSGAVDELVVVGDGERRDELERAARDRPMRVTGRLPDDEAFPLVASAEVAVNPQHASDLQVASSPVKLYYYAALGRPTVATRGPDAAAWLADEGGAELVEPGGDFAGTVADLLADDERRKRMGQTATRVVERATWERRAARLARLHGIGDESGGGGGG